MYLEVFVAAITEAACDKLTSRATYDDAIVDDGTGAVMTENRLASRRSCSGGRREHR